MRKEERLAIIKDVTQGLSDMLWRKTSTSVNVLNISTETAACVDDHDLQKKMVAISASSTIAATKKDELYRLGILLENPQFEESYTVVDLCSIAVLHTSAGDEFSYILLPGGNGIRTSKGIRACTLNSPLGKELRYKKADDDITVNGRSYIIKNVL